MTGETEEAFDTVRLSSGQLVQMKEGVAEVKASPPVAPEPVVHHYRLTVRHKEADGPTRARAADYDQLISFLKQLEALDYGMVSLERIAGPVPGITH